MTAGTNEPEASDQPLGDLGASVGDLMIPDRLGLLQRFIAALIAVVAGAAGGLAVFVTDNAAGAVALLTLSALFGVLSLTGYSISKAKFGESEIVFAKALSSSVARRIERAPEPVAEELASAVMEAEARTRGPLVAKAQSVQEGLRYERESETHSCGQFQKLPSDLMSAVRTPLTTFCQ